MITNVFFYTSGEHPDLPGAEVRAILEAEGIEYETRMEFTQVTRLATDPEALLRVGERAGMTHVCCVEMLACDADVDAIEVAFGESPELEIEGSFEVRVRRIRGSSPEIRTMELESLLGKLVESRYPRLKVRLRGADFRFLGLLTSDAFVFGLVRSAVSAKGFERRRPSRRPFFHPTAVHPKLARSMVNLSRPMVGDVLLDPFCGTGGLLVEAELIGCRGVGSDIDPVMVEGCGRNLTHLGLVPEGLLVADARKLPFIRVDAISTDPPFGKATKTFGATAGEILVDFLSNIDRVLPKGRFICTSAPEDVGLGDVGVGLGLHLHETYLVYVHKALTREICVFRK